MSTANDGCIQYPYKAEADTSEDKEFWYVSVPAVDYIREAFFGAISTLGFPDSYNPISDVAAEYGSEIGASLTQFPGSFVSDQVANTVYAGPTSGAAAPPAFRPVVSADIATALTTPPPIGGTTPAAGTFSPLTVLSPAAATIVASIKGFASQTADLLRFLDSSNTVLTAVKSDGRWDIGNTASGAKAMNVYKASIANGTLAVFQGDGITSGGSVVQIFTNAVTGSVYAMNANVNSSGDGYFSIQQNGAGNSVFLHRVIGAGDAKSVYQKNGGQSWAVGYDQSDSERFKISANFNLGSSDRVILDVDGAAQHNRVTAGTNAVVDVLTVHHESSGTPAAGFGAGIVANLESSTTLNRKASIIETLWNTPTDAGAIADLVLSAYYNPAGSPTKREGLRIRGGVSGVEWALAGGTVGPTQTVTGSRGGNAALADLLTKLAAKGIIVDGSS